MADAFDEMPTLRRKGDEEEEAATAEEVAVASDGQRTQGGLAWASAGPLERTILVRGAVAQKRQTSDPAWLVAAPRRSLTLPLARAASGRLRKPTPTAPTASARRSLWRQCSPTPLGCT